MNKDITSFVQDELYPLMFSHIDTIFPEMSFKDVCGKWHSPKNIDGTNPRNHRADKTIVTKNKPTRALENGGGGSKDLITLYMDLNHTDFIGAVKDICNIVGLEVPASNREAEVIYQEQKKKQDAREESLKRQKDALWGTNGSKALMYLKSRGWSREDIEAAELGFIDEAEAKLLDAQKGIGTEYVLSIPLRTAGRIYGFKFRALDDRPNKYQYLKGTIKKDNLFGLTGIKNQWNDIIVVEGELDALHAQVKGIENVVATSGGFLTQELLQAAKNKGIKNVTLLLDNDKAGEEFVRKSIEVAKQMKMAAFVASLKDAKDVDAFLKEHSIEELKTIIAEANTASMYQLGKYMEAAYEKQGGEGGILKDKDRIELQRNVIQLANHCEDDIERDSILSLYGQYFGDYITKEALLAVADERRAEEDALTKKVETGAAIKEIEALYNSGRIEDALSKMKEASTTIRNIDHRKKYSSLLSIPSESDIVSRMKKRQDAIPTLYEFRRGTDKERLTIPSGAITFICAGTSHGKSTLLQNIALQVADQAKEGETVLYFTFEEDKDSVFIQMLNKSMNIELCRNYDANSSNNLRAISHFYRTGEDKFIYTDKKEIFKQKRASFISKYITSGKMRIYYEDFDCAEMIEAIKYLSTQVKIKAVFVDYIQLLNSIEYRAKRMVRTEELKEMCKDLKNLAVGYDIPIVVAAQLNREAKSPIDMHSQNIAEAADLERIANKIILLWNSSFKAQKSDKNDMDLKNFEENVMPLGVGGKMYATISKNRGGVVGLAAVLNYTGNTGVIEPNFKEEHSQSNLPFGEERKESFF